MRKASIRIDRDGLWYFEGREIIRRDILSLFYASLHLEEDGYYIEINGERQYLEVEDTVFLVQGAELIRDSEEAFVISLNDGTEEQLDLHTFRIAEGNIPYCLVNFYQLARHALHDEKTDEFFLLLNGRRIVLQAGS